jgi:hypothetical protein
MSDDRLPDDDDLKAAFRSVRDAYDGTNAEANATLHRALFRTRAGARRGRLTRWVVVPIAAAPAATTAWAGMSGKLTPAVESVLESLRPERTPPAPAPAPAPTTAAALPSEPASTASPAEGAQLEAPSAAAPAVPLAVVAPPPAAPPVVAPRSGSSDPAPSPLPAAAPVDPPHGGEPAPAAPSAHAPDPYAGLFAEAHRLHFIDRDPARALAAWDRYLAAAPEGRFAPEARYNRALALVRLGRHAEARAELAPFARGAYGSYRRDEAKALLDALARDASAP